MDVPARDAATLRLARPLARPVAAARALAATPAYPMVFTAAYVIQKLQPSWSPIDVALRPLVVLVVAVALVQLAVGRLVGRSVAAYFVGLLVLVLVEPLAALLVLLLVVGPQAWISVRRGRVVPTDWPALAVPMNLIAVGALAATLVFGITGGWLFTLPAAGSRATAVAPAADSPDIYLILLDAYPGKDALLRDVGVDNGPFLADMEALGFDVAESSHSNYTRTALTLASMFNGRRIDELLPDLGGAVGEQARALSRLLNDGALLDVARSRGYEVVTLPSAVSWLKLASADRVIEPPELNEFELTLTEEDLVGRIGSQARREFFLSQHRERTLWGFETLGRLPSEDAARPRLIFAHMLLPHPPFTFGPNGEPIVVNGCVWTLCDIPNPMTETFRAAYRGQLEYLNGVVELTARRIIDGSPRPPIVVFFSDHGSRLSGNFDSMFDNLTLSYTPGKSGVLPDDVTPVTLLPRLMNAYLGTDVPLTSEGSYAQPAGAFGPVAGPVTADSWSTP